MIIIYMVITQNRIKLTYEPLFLLSFLPVVQLYYLTSYNIDYVRLKKEKYINNKL